MNCSPFKLRVIVGSAAPMEVYKLVKLNASLDRVARKGRAAMTKRQLTNSTAVRRMDSAREKMIHQNFQSFGTP